MITYLTRNKLDIAKYNTCIAQAQNTRIYAYSWYLDCVADNWDVLVLNDYQAVMPLPWRSKYFIKYLYPPSWTQQLGVFSSEEINSELVQLFLHTIPKKFKKQTIFLNSENKTNNVTSRANYILPLNKSYETLFKEYYNSKLRNKLRRGNKQQSEVVITIEDSNSFKEVIDLFKGATAKNITINKGAYSKLEALSKVLLQKEKLQIKKVFVEGQLCAGSFFIKDTNRITYLFSSSNAIGKKEKAMPIIIDAIIKENSNTATILDFEGSSVPSIATFIKNFGAELENYFSFEKPFSLLK